MNQRLVKELGGGQEREDGRESSRDAKDLNFVFKNQVLNCNSSDLQ